MNICGMSHPPLPFASGYKVADTMYKKCKVAAKAPSKKMSSKQPYAVAKPSKKRARDLAPMSDSDDELDRDQAALLDSRGEGSGFDMTGADDSADEEPEQASEEEEESVSAACRAAMGANQKPPQIIAKSGSSPGPSIQA